MPRSLAGIMALSTCSTLTGSSSVVSPSRFERRSTWVSTGSPGRPMATLRTTLPVFRPTPGQGDQVGQVAGDLATEALHQRGGHALDALGLVAEEPGGADDLLDLHRRGRRQVVGGGPPAGERRASPCSPARRWSGPRGWWRSGAGRARRGWGARTAGGRRRGRRRPAGRIVSCARPFGVLRVPRGAEGRGASRPVTSASLRKLLLGSGCSLALTTAGSVGARASPRHQAPARREDDVQAVDALLAVAEASDGHGALDGAPVAGLEKGGRRRRSPASWRGTADTRPPHRLQPRSGRGPASGPWTW